jgi:WD40 repeat protein
VWNGKQKREFLVPGCVPLCIAYHPLPLPEDRGGSQIIVCGFDDGVVRIFDITRGVLLDEYMQHSGPVVQVLFSHNGARLFSASEDTNGIRICVGSICFLTTFRFVS